MCILGVCLIFVSWDEMVHNLVPAIVTRVNCPFNLVSLCINQKIETFIMKVMYFIQPMVGRYIIQSALSPWTFQREPNASSVSIDWTYRRQPLYWNKIPAPMRQLTIEHKRHCSSQHSEKEEVLCHLFLVDYLSCQHELLSKIPVSTNGKACEIDYWTQETLQLATFRKRRGSVSLVPRRLPVVPAWVA